jgi:DNA-binding MarR family transcriptional regulator
MSNESVMQSTEFEVCMNLSYRKATRVISQIYDRELADCGIKCTQFTILRATFLLKKTTNAELQERLVLDQTTLTRGLKPLVRDGLIQVEPGEDRRQKILSLTGKGKDLYRKAEKKWQRAQEHVRHSLGQETMDQMIKMNTALVALRK